MSDKSTSNWRSRVADFAAGEMFSQVFNWLLANWQPLAGGAVLTWLSQYTFDTATFAVALFWGLVSFIGGGALIATWRNQSVQHRILRSPEHNLLIGNCRLLAVEHKPNHYQLVITMHNTGNFPIRTRINRAYAKLNSSLGNADDLLNLGGEVAGKQYSQLVLNEYELKQRKEPYHGDVHLDINYGDPRKEKYLLKVFSKVSFFVDGSDVVDVSGVSVEPFKLI